MLKLTKTGIGLLTKQYRSVLRKCLLLNLGVFALTAANTINAYALTEGVASGTWSLAIGQNSTATRDYSFSFGDAAKTSALRSLALGSGARADAEYSTALGSWSSASENYVISVGHKSTDLSWDGSLWGADLFRRIVNVAAGQNDHDVVILKQLNDALNYYYTFRVDERAEHTKFTGELKSNEKEMSSPDFMPIKSSSDLRINLIKAEDPLTFSAKTRDDSLVLMEVCHA